MRTSTILLVVVVAIPIALGSNAWVQLLKSAEGPDGASIHAALDVDANSIARHGDGTSSLTLRLSIDEDGGPPQLRHIVSVEHVVMDCNARTYRVIDGTTAYLDRDHWVPGPSPASGEPIHASRGNPRALALLGVVCAYLK